MADVSRETRCVILRWICLKGVHDHCQQVVCPSELGHARRLCTVYFTDSYPETVALILFSSDLFSLLNMRLVDVEERVTHLIQDSVLLLY